MSLGRTPMMPWLSIPSVIKKTFSMAYFPVIHDLQTPAGQQHHSVGTRLHNSEDTTTCMRLKPFLCISVLKQLHVTSRKRLPQKSFNFEILLFSCLKNTVLFSANLSEKQNKKSSYSAIRFGASPNKAEVSRQSGARTPTPTPTRTHTHKHTSCPIVSLIRRYLHTRTSLPSGQHSRRTSVAQ